MQGVEGDRATVVVRVPAGRSRNGAAMLSAPAAASILGVVNSWPRGDDDDEPSPSESVSQL